MQQNPNERKEFTLRLLEKEMPNSLKKIKEIEEDVDLYSDREFFHNRFIMYKLENNKEIFIWVIESY